MGGAGQRSHKRDRAVRHRGRTESAADFNRVGTAGVRASVEGLGRGSVGLMKQNLQANGRLVEAALPCSLEDFLRGQKLLPKSVVVEHNGEAVAPSEFSKRTVQAG